MFIGFRKQVVWSFWEQLVDIEDLEESRRQSRCRILYRGPRGSAWFLGERVLQQTTGLVWVPQPPPTSILRPMVIPISRRVELRQGVPAGYLVIAHASLVIFLPPGIEVCVILDFVDMNIFISFYVGENFIHIVAETTEHDGYVLPDCRITYTVKGGSEITKVLSAFPDGEGFQPLVP